MFEGFGSVFSKMFGKEPNKKPELSSTEKKAQIASRRNFLKGVGAIGAAAAVEKLIPTAEAAEKKLTGEFLMRRMQPEAYLFGDPTFFTTKQNGQWQEIGENERQSPTSQTA